MVWGRLLVRPSMRATVSGVSIECVQGDISAQPGFAAIVNAANARLAPGGGVSGAIHRAAGPGLAAECAARGPIRPGEAVITGGHRLPNRYVIHCLGPVYGTDEPAAKILAQGYLNSLRLAEGHGLDSIAFPAISTGIFGYPHEEAADVALRTILGAVPSLASLKRIRFVLFARADLEVHERVLSRLLPST
jgi:O-acetyl-ADP-ribose deacetylase (regulator of RNase III)